MLPEEALGDGTGRLWVKRPAEGIPKKGPILFVERIKRVLNRFLGNSNAGQKSSLYIATALVKNGVET